MTDRMTDWYIAMIAASERDLAQRFLDHALDKLRLHAGLIRACDYEFGEHEHDDVECARVLNDMSPDDWQFDPMDDIPWGTPDSWIPDNPNEDGFCRSDFI